jgi:hypothetical protein
MTDAARRMDDRPPRKPTVQDVWEPDVAAANDIPDFPRPVIQSSKLNFNPLMSQLAREIGPLFWLSE